MGGNSGLLTATTAGGCGVHWQQHDIRSPPVAWPFMPRIIGQLAEHVIGHLAVARMPAVASMAEGSSRNSANARLRPRRRAMVASEYIGI